MKINFTDVDDNFIAKQNMIGGEVCTLVYPKHIGCDWNKRNLIFRSSIWNMQGELVSAGLKKFFNWGEKPDLYYKPFSTTANGGIECRTKIDGSCLIISKYKDELIHRTRGTFNAEMLDNGNEIKLLREKYPHLFDNKFLNNEDHSIILEWVTPSNKIVINYGELDVYLLAIIKHDDYSLMTQRDVDYWAVQWGVKRAGVTQYHSIKEMVDDVTAWENSEGIVIYCNHDQTQIKLKSSWYLALHRMKDQLGSFEKVVDFYFENGEKSYNDTYNDVVNTLDYEIAEEIRGDISRIVDGMKKVKKILDGFDNFVQSRNLQHITRKDAADQIKQAYGSTNRASMVFLRLDNKSLETKHRKKLLYQVLKQ